MIIYTIENVENGKVYIGQTIVPPATRWYEHKRTLNLGTHINYKLQDDWNIYGEPNFIFTELFPCASAEELDILEKQLIKEAREAGQCYNISEGGQVSRIVYQKEWSGLVSPDGVEYPHIENMAEFARTHGLSDDKLRQVSRGTRYSYKGWTTMARGKLVGWRVPKGYKMSAESNHKRSVALKKAYKEGRKVASESSKKIYHGIISPEGQVYNNVVGLAGFCRQHDIKSCGRMSELCSKKINSYKGWTYGPSVTN